jgi:hypothetical protein
LTPWSKVTQISASHFDDETAYISVSRFRIDDLRPYIYRTHDGGKTWQEITNGLPGEAPVDTVREDPVRKGLLFAGTENAVWASSDDGDHWQSLQLNLPHTSMRDLWVHEDDLIVATHGRSFWILDDIAPLRQISAALANAEAHLFDPAPAYRVRRDTNTDTPLPADEPAGENPPDGAAIDYVLAKPASGEVALEILDAQGKVVRRYSSTDQPEQTQEQLEKQLIPLYWLHGPKIPSRESGMHRWIWDLRYPPPLSAEHEYPIAAVPHNTPRYPFGPMALPGKYTVRLTANGHAYEAPLTVKMDPRVKVSPADLQKKLDLEMQLVSAVTRSSEAVLQARSVHEQLGKVVEGAKGPLNDLIKTLDEKVSAVLNGPKDSPASSTASSEPALGTTTSTVIALYKEVEKADAAPALAAVEAFTKTKGELANALKRWEQLKTTDIPALNRKLRPAGLPELRLGLPPQQGAGGENEE